MNHKNSKVIKKKLLENTDFLKKNIRSNWILKANTFENLNEIDYILGKCDYPKLTLNGGYPNGSNSGRNWKLLGIE